MEAVDKVAMTPRPTGGFKKLFFVEDKESGLVFNSPAALFLKECNLFLSTYDNSTTVILSTFILNIFYVPDSLHGLFHLIPTH